MKKIVQIISVAALLTGFAPALHAQTTPNVDAGKGLIQETTDAANSAAKTKPKPKKVMAKAKKKVPGSVVVKITNARDVAVTSFTVFASGMIEGGVSLTKALPAGKATTLKLNTKKGCTFDIRGAFEDEAAIEADSVDFCADTKLVLKE